MSSREDRLYYTGDGAYYLPGIPARDLDAADVAALTDRLYADAIAPNPATGKALYQKTKPANRETAPKRKRKRKSAAKKAAAPAPAETPVEEETTEAAPAEDVPAGSAATE